MKSGRPSPLRLSLHKLLRTFFQHDIALRRRDGAIRLVLEDRQASVVARPPTRAEQAAQKEETELAQARADLARVLDEEAGLRSRLRHLAFVEHALSKKGWRSLHKVPLEMLQTALEQLEGRVTNWSSTGIACLRSKMAVAVIDREHHDPEREADAYRTAAVLDNPPSLAAQVIQDAKASAAADDDEDAALLAAYAALGVAPADAVEVQPELGSLSAKGSVRGTPASAAGVPEIRLRDLQS